MRPRFRAMLALPLVLCPLVLWGAACSSNPPEQQLLSQFFRAARTRDNETLGRMSSVELDPREYGEVTRFTIVSVSPEQRTPLDYASLQSKQTSASQSEMELRKRRLEFENANRAALEAIAKMERDPTAKFTPEQQAMKAEWDRFKQEAMAMQKGVASAKAAFASSTGPAEASLAQPGQPPFAADKFQGALISKDVMINADVRKDGQTTNKPLTVTIQRVEGTQDGAERRGRSIIARVQGL